MSERNTREEREALIAGDAAASLRPDEAADVALLADLLADPSTWAEPPPELEGSVIDAVLAAPAASEDAESDNLVSEAAASDDVASDNVVPDNVVPDNVVSMPRRGAASGWWRAAVAVAAAIVIVLGVFVVTRGGPDPEFESELAATALAPQASGSVDITQNAGGFQVTLDARGLAPLPAGEYYQAWLKDARGTLVAIGSFSSSDDTVTLWSGVSPTDFPTMTVTIESADGEQASSGRVVLAGSVRSR